MGEDTNTPDVIVLGAGVIGTASAYRLSSSRDVLVVDKDTVAGDTTSRASGTIVTQQLYHAYPDIVDHVVSFFREFDGTGIFRFNECQRVNLVPAGSGENARKYAEDTSGVSFHTQEEAKDRYPRIDVSGYDGLVRYKDTGFVDPVDYTLSLKREAEKNGAEFRTDTEVTNFIVEGGRVRGVETTYGLIEAEYVVCAAGWQTRPLLDGIVEIPVRPFRWDAVDVDPGWAVDEEFPMGSEPNAGFYWRPAPNGNLHLGGNQTLVDDPDERRTRVSDEFLTVVRNEVPKVLPDVDEARILGGESCPTGDSATPDTYPIIDSPAEAPDGLIVATGFQRGGVLVSPAAATAVQSLVTDQPAPFPTEQFALDRFDDRGTDFELATIYPAYTQ